MSFSRLKQRAKYRLRDAVANAAYVGGVTRASRRAPGRLNIATFHRVLPESERAEYPHPGLCVTPDELDWFLSYFVECYEVGPLSELAERFVAGRTGNKPMLALTFDDGEVDNLRYALPVLKRHGVRASFYVPTEHIETRRPIWHDEMGFALLALAQTRKAQQTADLFDAERLGALTRDAIPRYVQHTKAWSPTRRQDVMKEVVEFAGASHAIPEWARLMTWDEVRETQAAGHEIGSHSVTHALLPQCTDGELQREMEESKTVLERELGTPITSFCYPNGDNDARVRKATSDAGYRFGISTAWGDNPAGFDRFGMRRCDMLSEHARDRHGRLSQARVALRMSGLQPGL